MPLSLSSRSRRRTLFARSAARTVSPALAALVGITALSGCGGPPEVGPAADGTDYSACGDDAECEVAVAEPTDIVIGSAEGTVTLSVTAVTEDGIEFELATEQITSTGSLGGLCQAIISETYMHSNCFEEDALSEPDPARGELIVQLLGMNDGSAVLRIAGGV